MSGCGCDNSSSGEDNYLLVKTNKSLANGCGDPSATVSPVSSCLIQEPTFDVINSSFVLPVHGGAIDVSVCNVSAYSEGQYLEFINEGIVMLVAGINPTNRTITLRNTCANGNEIDSNVEAGAAVSSGAPFNVVGSPPCGESQDSAAIFGAIADAEEICIPEMLEGSSTAEFQAVGRIEQDEDNLDQGKCLKRIPGVFFNPEGPTFRGTDQLPSDQIFAYDFLAINRANGEVRAVPSPAVGTTGNQKAFLYTFSKTGTSPVGPAYVESMLNPFHLFEEKNTATDHNTYTALADAGTFSKDFPISVAAITDVLKSSIDHYYLELLVDVGLFATSGTNRRYLEVLINDISYGYVMGTSGGVMAMGHFRIPVRILKTDTKFTFKLKATNNGVRYYYKITCVSVKA